MNFGPYRTSPILKGCDTDIVEKLKKLNWHLISTSHSGLHQFKARKRFRVFGASLESLSCDFTYKLRVNILIDSKWEPITLSKMEEDSFNEFLLSVKDRDLKLKQKIVEEEYSKHLKKQEKSKNKIQKILKGL